MRSIVPIAAVHQCKELNLYLRAARGEVILFYGTKPMKVTHRPTDDEFGGEYLVPKHHAMRLHSLIQAETSPQEIVTLLGLKPASLDDVMDPDRTVKREYLTDAEQKELRKWEREERQGGISTEQAVRSLEQTVRFLQQAVESGAYAPARLYLPAQPQREEPLKISYPGLLGLGIDYARTSDRGNQFDTRSKKARLPTFDAYELIHNGRWIPER